MSPLLRSSCSTASSAARTSPPCPSSWSPGSSSPAPRWRSRRPPSSNEGDAHLHIREADAPLCEYEGARPLRSSPPGVARVLHVLRGAGGRFDAEIARDDVQRHVDSGGEAASRRDAPAVDEAKPAPELYVRELLGEVLEEVVVRGRRNALQEACAR